MESEGRKSWTLEVQAWHILLLLAIQLLALGAAYGRITQQQDDLGKEITRIESTRTISKDEFDEWKTELLKRMDRIENKIDSEYIGK